MSASSYGQEHLDALFAAIDNCAADAFVEFLTKDASFRFGSAPAMTGRAEIARGVGAFFKTIAACKHRVAKTIVSGNTMVCEGAVTYRRHDDSEVTVPFVDVFEIDGDLISDYKIYIDTTPLFAS